MDFQLYKEDAEINLSERKTTTTTSKPSQDILKKTTRGSNFDSIYSHLSKNKSSFFNFTKKSKNEIVYEGELCKVSGNKLKNYYFVLKLKSLAYYSLSQLTNYHLVLRRKLKCNEISIRFTICKLLFYFFKYISFTSFHN